LIEATTFFPGNRRRLELEDWQPLLNEQSEKRVRLDLLMPLTGQPFLGLPDYIGQPYERMDQENSATLEVKLDGDLEGITVETFSTDSAQFPIESSREGLEMTPEDLGRRHILLPASTLRNFKLLRITRNKQPLVALKFSLTTKADPALVLWAYRYHGANFWAVFTETEPELKGPKGGDQMQLTADQQKEETEKAAEQDHAGDHKRAPAGFGRKRKKATPEPVGV
jgi:hypothetical protein